MVIREQYSTRSRFKIAILCIKILATAALLVIIYRSADLRRISESLARLQVDYFSAALLLFIPQTILSAVRWRWLVLPTRPISLLHSTRQILVASAVNLLVPSKLGDFSKATMFANCDKKTTLWLATLSGVDKGLDLCCLLAVWGCGVLGFGLLPASLSIMFVAWLMGALIGPRCSIPLLGRAAACSALLWSIHLLQIQWFMESVGIDVPWHVVAAKVPVALLAGLLPISLWGLGTRDQTLIWIFQDTASSASMAAVGALTALRYLIPGLAGGFVLLQRWRADDRGVHFIASLRHIEGTGTGQSDCVATAR